MGIYVNLINDMFSIAAKKTLIVFLLGLLLFGCVGVFNVFIFSNIESVHHEMETGSCCSGGLGGAVLHLQTQTIVELEASMALIVILFAGLMSVVDRVVVFDKTDNYIDQIKLRIGSFITLKELFLFLSLGKLHPKVI